MEFSNKVARSHGFNDGWNNAFWTGTEEEIKDPCGYEQRSDRDAYWDGYILGFERGQARRKQIEQNLQKDQSDKADERDTR